MRTMRQVDNMVRWGRCVKAEPMTTPSSKCPFKMLFPVSYDGSEYSRILAAGRNYPRQFLPNELTWMKLMNENTTTNH